MRSKATYSQLSTTFKQASLRVPQGLVTEIAYDRKTGQWNCFILSYGCSESFLVGQGKDPLEALEDMCILNRFTTN